MAPAPQLAMRRDDSTHVRGEPSQGGGIRSTSQCDAAAYAGVMQNAQRGEQFLLRQLSPRVTERQ
jgi:hypothetical protein